MSERNPPRGPRHVGLRTSSRAEEPAAGKTAPRRTTKAAQRAPGGSARVRRARVVREYGPFPGIDDVHGVTFDGRRVWFATNRGLHSLDPDSGELGRTLDVPSDAGTAFDGRYLYQLAEATISKVDPETGRVLATIPAPGHGGDSGLTWAEGLLWVGQYRDRKILCIDPETGRVLRTIESDRFVTGVTWFEGELWHGTLDGRESELRQVNPESGEVLERLELPPGVVVTGLERRGDTFYCGGATSGKVRAVRRPGRARKRAQ
jgi:hypothetical protein